MSQPKKNINHFIISGGIFWESQMKKNTPRLIAAKPKGAGFQRNKHHESTSLKNFKPRNQWNRYPPGTANAGVAPGEAMMAPVPELFKKPGTWWFKVTFLGWLSDPFKGLSDLQLGDEKGTLNHLEKRHSLDIQLYTSWSEQCSWEGSPFGCLEKSRSVDLPCLFPKVLLCGFANANNSTLEHVASEVKDRITIEIEIDIVILILILLIIITTITLRTSSSSGPGTVHIKVFCEVAQEPFFGREIEPTPTFWESQRKYKGDSRIVGGRNTAPVTQLRLVASFNPVIYEVLKNTPGPSTVQPLPQVYVPFFVFR